MKSGAMADGESGKERNVSTVNEPGENEKWFHLLFEKGSEGEQRTGWSHCKNDIGGAS